MKRALKLLGWGYVGLSVLLTTAIVAAEVSFALDGNGGPI